MRTGRGSRLLTTSSRVQVNITRGRCIGNSGIAFTTDVDQYAVNGETVSAPFGGPPPLLPKEKGGCARDGCRTGQGNTFWNLGFVTLDIDAGAQPKILAKHWEVGHARGRAWGVVLASRLCWWIGAAGPVVRLGRPRLRLPERQSLL